MNKRSLIVLSLLLCLTMLFGQAKVRYKALNFENPGTRRILKTEAGNHYYYRSLPEKAMTLNTTGITRLEIRSFSNGEIRKPEIIIINGKSRITNSLKFKQLMGDYRVYEPFIVDLPANTSSIQVLCYDRNMYIRAYNILPVKAPKPKKPKNLEIKAHAGALSIQHNGSASDYYSFVVAQPLKFNLNNGRDAYVYVRPRLLDRSIPKLGLFVNGDLVETIEFDLKRTTKYHVQGIKNLGIAKKIELPENKGSSQYELRALSEHLFLAKPVLTKKK